MKAGLLLSIFRKVVKTTLVNKLSFFGQKYSTNVSKLCVQCHIIDSFNLREI